jgi:hypothetical protein
MTRIERDKSSECTALDAALGDDVLGVLPFRPLSEECSEGSQVNGVCNSAVHHNLTSLCDAVCEA